MRARVAILTTIAMLAAVPALADTKAGVEAWERGDYRTAVDQWRAAADGGDADAQFNMGQAYKLGRGVPVDAQRAEEYYGRAAAQGHVQAADNYGLALFQNGKAREAIPYLEKSVVRGEPRAQYILGTMLFNGVDIKKDWVRAYALTSKAAEAGLPQATQSLQQMDAYVGVNDRQQGLAMARGMVGSGDGALPSQVAGAGSGGGMRGVDLPPSYASNQQGGPRVAPPPSYAQPQPQPRYETSGQPVLPPSYAQAGQPVPNRLPPAPQPVRRPPPPVQVAAQSTPAPAAAGRWRLQLGAFGEPGNARKLWGRSADALQADRSTM